MTTVLTLIGYDFWSRPVYQGDDGRVWKDVNCGCSEIDLYRASGDEFDGEPDYPINCEFVILS